MLLLVNNSKIYFSDIQRVQNVTNRLFVSSLTDGVKRSENDRIEQQILDKSTQPDEKASVVSFTTRLVH
jgi:hypothetical protein